MTFNERLYKLRKEKGLSQEALANNLGVSRQAISRWELGEVVPDTANVLSLCEFFGVSADDLMCTGVTDSAGRQQEAIPVSVAEGVQTQETREDREEAEAAALRRDIRAVNLNIIVRSIIMGAWCALHLWLDTDDPGWCFSLFLCAGIGVVGQAVLSFRWFIRERGSFALLKWDLLLTAIGLLLPRLMIALIPGNLSVFLGAIPGVLVIVFPVRTLLQEHYRVEPPGRRPAEES